MIQQSKKLKILDEKRLLEKQNKQRVKYGLKPHKRLDTELIIFKHDKELQTNKNESENIEDSWRMYA